MNFGEALTLEKGDRIIILLLPENSALEWGRCVEAVVWSTLGVESGEVLCEVEVLSPGDILEPFPHTERWLGYIELRHVVGKAGCFEDKHD